MNRVLIFSLAYYPRFVGGAEVALKEVTNRLPEFEFHMVTLRFDSGLPRQERIGNVTVHRIGFSCAKPTSADLKQFPLVLNKYFFQLIAAVAALHLHRRYRFDAIWAMMAHSSGIPAGLFKTVHPDVPYVLTLQEGDPLDRIERLAFPVWPLFKRGFTLANHIIAESTFLGLWARRMGFSGPLTVIPNGMDSKRFAARAPEKMLQQLRAQLGKKERETWLIHTGRLVHKNALDVVICALPLLPVSIHLLMLGDGPDKDALLRLAEKKGVRDRVHFHPYVPLSEIPDYLKACDIFVRPSRSEGMGNSFIEAMAAGLPIIGTQEGGIADFLFDTKRNPDREATGWAVDVDSFEQIAQAVKDILEFPEKARQIAEKGRRLALADHDWDLIAWRTKEVFDTTFG